MTQAQLAAKARVQQVTISGYESGRIREPGASRMAALARVLNVSLEWLATGRTAKRAA